jgi:hypothetical protein
MARTYKMKIGERTFLVMVGVVIVVGVGGDVLYLIRSGHLQPRGNVSKAIPDTVPSITSPNPDRSAEQKTQPSPEAVSQKLDQADLPQNERERAKRELEEAKARSEEMARERNNALSQQHDASSPIKGITAATSSSPQVAAAPGDAKEKVVEVPPIITRRVNPVMPRVANKAFLTSNLRDGDIKVVLKVFVNLQGKPVKAVILQGVSGPFGFNDSATNASLASDYTPGTLNGNPVGAWLTLEYNFGMVR